MAILILCPKFVKDHANYALLDLVITDLITSEDDSSRHFIISQSIDYKSLNSRKFELEFRMPIVPRIIGSCSGMLLFRSESDDKHVLWNPLFSNKYKFLPESNFGSYYGHFNGFGYALSIDDYKVVRVLKPRYIGHKVSCYSDLKVEVYSLKTDSWKIISGIPPPNIEYSYIRPEEGIHVSESIYWLIYDQNNKAIIAFDLVTEKFKLIETPLPDDNSAAVASYLKTKKFAMLDTPYICSLFDRLVITKRQADEFVTWIWNENGNMPGYWTRSLTITMKYPSFTRILSFLNNDQVLLVVVEISKFVPKLVIYDSACMTFRDTHCEISSWPVQMVGTLLSPICGH